MKLHLRSSTAIALAATAISAGAAVAQSFPEDAEIRAILEERIGDGRGVGLVVGLLEPDGTRRFITAGSAGADRPPLDEHTLFEIGSVTKTFTGVLLAEMDRRGEVEMDAPVTRYLPPGTRIPSRAGREITLADLATHRSSLPRLPGNLAPADMSNPYASYTVEQMFEFLSSYELPRDIGSEAEYSNLGVGLLGHVLGLVAGDGYEAALRDRVLEPLGMDNTAIDVSGERAQRIARGHDATGAEVPLWDLPALAGAGALRSDAADMLRWAGAHLDGDPDGLATALRVAQEPRAAISEGQGSATDIGLGWMMSRARDRRFVWHTGATGGFYSFVGFEPDRGRAVVLLANAQHPVDDIARHLLDPANPITRPQGDRTEVEISPDILDDYLGEYQLAPTFSIVVSMGEGTLLAQATGQPAFPIFPEGDDRFFYRVVDAQITFQRGDDGRVTGLVLHQNGQNVPGPRLPD